MSIQQIDWRKDYAQKQEMEAQNKASGKSLGKGAVSLIVLFILLLVGVAAFAVVTFMK